MLTKIKTWIKDKFQKFKKWIIITFSVGVVLAASIVLTPSIIPFIDVNGEIITFSYTDDNSGENLIIYTDKGIYSSGDYIYVALENKSDADLINLQFYFNDDKKEISKIEKLVENMPIQVEIPEYKTIKYDCDYYSTSTDSIIKQTCERNKQIGSYLEIQNKDIWVDEKITDFSKVNNDLFVSKINEKPKNNYKTLQKVEISLTNNFTYYRVKIKAPLVFANSEFFVEAIGENAYGHLDPTLTDNIVAYWKLEGNSTDELGSHNGTDTSITYGTDYGKIDQGAYFGGSSKVTVADDAAFSFTNEIFSISLWMKGTSPTANRAFMVTKASWALGVYEWALFNDDASHANIECWTSAGTSIMTAISTTNVFDGAWHHIVVTADGSKGYIYVDGSEQSGGGVSFTGGMSDTAAPLLLGFANGLTPGITGSLDEVGIWSRALSGAEVTELYNSGAGLQYPFTVAGNVIISQPIIF